MPNTIPDIIKENEQRKKVLDREYDPIMGIGATMDRFPFFVMQGQKVPCQIPRSMESLQIVQDVLKSPCRSLEEYCIRHGMDVGKTTIEFNDRRLDHDFEFWCVLTVKIKPKTGGKHIPFVLNRAQQKILSRLEEQRLANKPIRAVLLKARQFGGSTVVQIYISWIQIRHKTNWNSLIAAHINQAATNIRAMLKTVVTNYPLEKLSFRPFEGTHNIKVIPERSNKITVGSMETPDSIRSDDVAMFHGSEVGLWKKTEGKKPEDLIQSILGTIPNMPMSVVVLESTAKGVGSYFHRTWLQSKENGSYVPIFVPWYEIDMYQIEFESNAEKESFINSMDEYESQLWKYGATLEGIKWYRQKLGEYNGDRVIMCSEFPSDDVEAFQSTGQRFFPVSVVQNARRFNRPPILVGDVYGDARKGPDALKNIKIEALPKGNLWVWSMPEKFDDVKYVNRYLVTLDIGGRSKEADDSVIKVYDRFWMMEGGIMEVAAVWAGKIDFDHLAWKAVQICKLYDDAFFVPEVNKMREDTSSFEEGDQFYTLVDEIIEHYNNIFCRTTPEQIRQGLPKVYGFHMNRQTKPMVLSALNAAYRDSQVAEFDHRACDQADTYENKGNGSTGAVDGANDDHVIVSAIGAWAGLSYMDPVQEVAIRKGATGSRKLVGAASF